MNKPLLFKWRRLGGIQAVFFCKQPQGFGSLKIHLIFKETSQLVVLQQTRNRTLPGWQINGSCTVQLFYV